MMEIETLRKAMLAKAKSRPDFYIILAMVTGFPESRLIEIARGQGKPATVPEIIVLSAHAGGQ